MAWNHTVILCSVWSVNRGCKHWSSNCVHTCTKWMKHITYSGIPACHLNKVQCVLNAAVRLIDQAPRFCYITQLMQELHWLPVKEHISFKILLLTFKAIHRMAPEYIQDLIMLKSEPGRYSLGHLVEYN